MLFLYYFYNDGKRRTPTLAAWALRSPTTLNSILWEILFFDQLHKSDLYPQNQFKCKCSSQSPSASVGVNFFWHFLNRNFKIMLFLKLAFLPTFRGCNWTKTSGVFDLPPRLSADQSIFDVKLSKSQIIWQITITLCHSLTLSKIMMWLSQLLSTRFS